MPGGTSLAGVDLAAYPGLAIVGIQRDVVIIRSEGDVAVRFAEDLGLEFLNEPVTEHVAGALMTPDMGVAEVVVSPRSELVGDIVFPGMVTHSGDLVILAVQRKGHDQGPSGTKLAAGDTLLVQGSWEALARNVDDDPGVLAVDSLETLRRQAVPLGRRAKEAIVILGAMVLLRVLSVDQAYRGMSWTTVIIVGGMLPLSAALQVTGVADTMANALVDVVGEGGLGRCYSGRSCSRPCSVSSSATPPRR